LNISNVVVAEEDFTEFQNCMEKLRSEEDQTLVQELLQLYDALKTMNSDVVQRLLEDSIGDDPEIRPHLDTIFVHQTIPKDRLVEKFKLVFIGITHKAIIEGVEFADDQGSLFKGNNNDPFLIPDY